MIEFEGEAGQVQILGLVRWVSEQNGVGMIVNLASEAGKKVGRAERTVS